MNTLIALSVLVISLIVLVLLIQSLRTPSWAKDPCPNCGYKMTWTKGQEHGITREARFTCFCCEHKELRGGVGSELQMEISELL